MLACTVLSWDMTEHTRTLFQAATSFDLDDVRIRVLAGERCDHVFFEHVFLGDQGRTLSEDDPKTPGILAQLNSAGRVVEDENDALFELYETLLMAGHPIPDGSSRRCLNRVIAGARTSRHQRALHLMTLCNDQGMLSWANSQWARETLADRAKKENFIPIMLPTATSNDLFADAVGQAARAGNLVLLDYLCTHIPAGIKGQSTVLVDLSLPTHKAAEGGHLDCLRYLLGIMRDDQWEQARPNTRPALPLLCVAAGADQVHIVKWLLDQGMDIDELGADGRSALMSAADGKASLDMSTLLLDRGADPNTGGRGPRALHLAVWRQTPGLVDLLLSRGADPNILDSSRSALMLAAMIGCQHDVENLISHGAQIEHQDDQGFTAMTYACRNGRLDAFLVLQAAGARMDIQNIDKLTPRDLAGGAIRAFLDRNEIDQGTPKSGFRPNSKRF